MVSLIFVLNVIYQAASYEQTRSIRPLLKFLLQYKSATQRKLNSSNTAGLKKILFIKPKLS